MNFRNLAQNFRCLNGISDLNSFTHNIREIEALTEMKEDYRRVGERKRDGYHFAYGKGKSGEDKGKFMYLALNCREIETIDVSTL